jgi:hypothetical protein
MGGFPDTGPQQDGTRTAAQWMNTMGEDAGLIRSYLQDTLDDNGLDRDEIAKKCALARKEAQRLLSDVGRFASEVHGLSRQDLDEVGRL